MKDRNMIMAEKIAARVAEKGGRTFYVGGYVRDKLLGIENKDIDIEIHGILPEVLEGILEEVGKKTEMGASFGIFGLKGYELDIAMPRKEEATGRGHKDFAVFVDPFLGTQKAAMRRDFTMNALMEDVLTGEIIDHFGGVEDMKKGVLRHVNTQTFVEDPLRVLRAAQFTARFGFSVAEETIELAKTMDLTTLARERIWGELEKALLKAKKPSIFFEEMRKMEQLTTWFPEVEQLLSIDVDGESLWQYTMGVLDKAAAIKKQSNNPLWFTLAALTHDFGKMVMRQDNPDEVVFADHGTKGVDVATEFVLRINNETKLIKYVQNMTALHMEPGKLACEKAEKKVTNALFDKAVDPDDLVLLASVVDKNGLSEENEEFLQDRLANFHEIMARPCVMGADLVKTGLKPGPYFSEILAYAHELRLAEVEKDTALAMTLEKYRSL